MRNQTPLQSTYRCPVCGKDNPCPEPFVRCNCGEGYLVPMTGNAVSIGCANAIEHAMHRLGDEPDTTSFAGIDNWELQKRHQRAIESTRQIEIGSERRILVLNPPWVPSRHKYGKRCRHQFRVFIMQTHDVDKVLLQCAGLDLARVTIFGEIDEFIRGYTFSRVRGIPGFRQKIESRPGFETCYLVES